MSEDRIAQLEARVAALEDIVRQRPVDPDFIYTPAEVAERLRCSRTNVYDLLTRKELAHIKVGAGNKGFKVRGSDLLFFIESRKEGGRPAASDGVQASQGVSLTEHSAFRADESRTVRPSDWLSTRPDRPCRMAQVSVANSVQQNCNSMAHANAMRLRHDSLTLLTEVTGYEQLAIRLPCGRHASPMRPSYLRVLVGEFL